MLWSLTVLLLAGCGDENRARAIIEPASGMGKMMLAAAGSGEQLQSRGKIDKHGRIAGCDGAMIDVWVLHARASGAAAGQAATAPASKGAVVILHPLMASKAWFMPVAQHLAANGYDAVLVDNRAHGDSGGQYITWGAKEKRDVRAVMDSLLAAGDVHEPFYAFGASMGGCVAIQYAAFDPRCRGVVALAPPAGIRDVGRLLMPALSDADLDRAVARAGQIGGFDPNDSSAVAAAGELRCPLVISHGYLDIVVPYAQGERIFSAAHCPKKLQPAPLADHATIQAFRQQWVLQQIEGMKDMK
jgi:pimeloyl-ACP methyl ester carboxylesterase